MLLCLTVHIELMLLCQRKEGAEGGHRLVLGRVGDLEPSERGTSN